MRSIVLLGSKVRVDEHCVGRNYFDGVDDPFIPHRVYMHAKFCGFIRLLELGRLSKKKSHVLLEVHSTETASSPSSAQHSRSHNLIKFHDEEETYTPITFGPF